MRSDEVAAALGRPVSEPEIRRLHPPSEESFSEPNVTLYYTSAGHLAAVAVDALEGPQVTLDGTRLVGQTPSETEDWILRYTQERNQQLRYAHDGNPVSGDLGLFIRAQRAGDIVLTRPIFLFSGWTRDMWDCIPSREWMTSC
ncbi:hypothetical protein [Streptomyces sp. NPDC002133]|uniref:hypothetical protein n=1 Tax=Streptomyces sp. NPDC002133 TaxID=3154409 RepID=UPI00332E736C